MKAGRPSKYSKIRERLEDISTLASNGFTDEDISAVLRINPSTLYEYKKKYPEFASALKGGKIVSDSAVVSSLYKRAVGYDYEEESVEYKPTNKKDANGKETPAEVKYVRKTKKHIPPSVTAIALWLFNRRKEEWSRQQREIEIDPLRLPEFNNVTDEELIQYIEGNVKDIQKR